MESNYLTEVMQKVETPAWVIVAKGSIQKSLTRLFGDGAKCGDCSVAKSPDGTEEWSINIWNYAQGSWTFTLTISEALNDDTLRNAYDNQQKHTGGVI